MEITYGKRLASNQIIHLDRRNMGSGGHMLIVGDTGMGKTQFIKNEIVQILQKSDDIIYIFSKYNWEYEALFSLKKENMRYGKQNSYEEIIKQGNNCILDDQRIWVYFDQELSTFTSKEWNNLLYFMHRARKAGIIITIAFNDFEVIPENIFSSFIGCFECFLLFNVRDIKNKAEFFFNGIGQSGAKKYLKKFSSGNGMFISKNTGLIPISCGINNTHDQQMNSSWKRELENLFILYEESPKENIYTKEELESTLEPSAQKLAKKTCLPGQDIVQVTLPWLDEANDCIEVYIVREKNGEIRLEYD